MNTSTKKLIERVGSWPGEDIDKLNEVMCAVEAWRTGDHD
jgi:hypothetical protein